MGKALLKKFSTEKEIYRRENAGYLALAGYFPLISEKRGEACRTGANTFRFQYTRSVVQ
ncbi:hypothetical protein [Oscillospiraceae bacterium]|nr:hypothetical protein [Oscillospiraceae bacterium]